MNFEGFLSRFFAISVTLATAIILLGALFHPSFIHFGTIILLATPILRVLFCNIFFLNKGFYSLAGCTLFTLALLLLASLGFIKMQ